MKKGLLAIVVIITLGAFSSCKSKVEDGKCECTFKLLGVKSTEIYDKETYNISNCSELEGMDEFLGFGSFKCR